MGRDIARIKYFTGLEGGFHMGKAVKKFLKDNKYTVLWLSTQLGYNNANTVHNHFARSDWTIDMVLQCSIVLRHDFFKEAVDYYKNNVPTSLVELQHNEHKVIKQQSEIIKKLKEEIAMLKETISDKNTVIASLKSNLG